MAEKPNSSIGFSAGLKYWIIFMLVLYLLGYPLLLCIIFGLIAGVAAGTIAGWLNAEDDGLPARAQVAKTETPTVVEEETAVPEPRPRFQKYSMTGLKPRGYQRPAVRRFGWLFRK